MAKTANLQLQKDRRDIELTWRFRNIQRIMAYNIRDNLPQETLAELTKALEVKHQTRLNCILKKSTFVINFPLVWLALLLYNSTLTRASHRKLLCFLGPSISASINLLFLGVFFQTRSVAPAVATQSESGHESRHCELSGTTGEPFQVYIIGSGE